MATAPTPGANKATTGWRFSVFDETFHESELTLD